MFIGIQGVGKSTFHLERFADDVFPNDSAA